MLTFRVTTLGTVRATAMRKVWSKMAGELLLKNL